MVRSVVVKMKADVGEYIAPVGTATGVTEKFDDKVQATNRDLDKVPPASARAAAAMKALGLEAGKTRLELNDLGPGATNALQLIDKKLDDTRAKVKQFAADFNKTGSIDSFNLWQQATKDVSALERIKKQLSGAISDGVTEGANAGGQGFWNTLSSWFDAMPGPAKAVIVGGLVAVVAAAAAPIGAAINGALLAGTGLGGIGLIVAGQLHSPMVTGAAKQLAADLMGALGTATGGLAGRLGFGVGVVNTGLQQLITALGPSLQKLSNAIAPLAQGLAKFAIALGPGLSQAFDAAGPILLVLAARLPSIGRALSDFFSSLSRGGKGASEGLIYLIDGLNGLIRLTGQTIRVLSDLFQFFVAFADDFTGIAQKVFGWIPGIGKILEKNHQMFHDIRGGTDEASLGVDNLTASTDNLAGANEDLAKRMADATTASKDLSDALDKLMGINMTADQAAIKYKDSVQNLTDSIAQNGRQWDINTDAGRKNQQALLDAIDAAERKRVADINAGKDARQAAQDYNAQVDALLGVAGRAGDAKSALDAMKGKYEIDVQETYTTYFINEGTPPSQFAHGLAKGGIRAAQVGMIIPPSDPGTVLAGEPQTGGEVLTPLRGISQARAMALSRVVGNSYGFDVVPRGADRWSGARPAPVAASGGALRVELAISGGNDALSSLLMKMQRTGDLQLTATRV